MSTIEKLVSLAMRKGFNSEGDVLDYAFEQGWFKHRKFAYGSIPLPQLIALQNRLESLPDKVAE